jgi:hypothetical protein
MFTCFATHLPEPNQGEAEEKNPAKEEPGYIIKYYPCKQLATEGN